VAVVAWRAGQQAQVVCFVDQQIQQRGGDSLDRNRRNIVRLELLLELA
jgi:hypothetical protein